jgi:hypothetical protein
MRRCAALALCAWLPTAADAASLFGAETYRPGEVAVGLGGGLALVVPSVGVDLAAGVSSRVDLALHYDTYAGAAHTFAYETRLRLWRGERASVALRGSIAYSFWLVRRLLDFATEDIPLGNGLALDLGARTTVRVRGGVRLSFDLAAVVGLVSLVRTSPESHEARGDVRLRAITLGVHAEWRALWIRVGAYFPTSGLVPLGYVPLVEVGWTFAL